MQVMQQQHQQKGQVLRQQCHHQQHQQGRNMLARMLLQAHTLLLQQLSGLQAGLMMVIQMQQVMMVTKGREPFGMAWTPTTPTRATHTTSHHQQQQLQPPTWQMAAAGQRVSRQQVMVGMQARCMRGLAANWLLRLLRLAALVVAGKHTMMAVRSLLTMHTLARLQHTTSSSSRLRRASNGATSSTAIGSHCRTAPNSNSSNSNNTGHSKRGTSSSSHSWNHISSSLHSNTHSLRLQQRLTLVQVPPPLAACTPCMLLGMTAQTFSVACRSSQRCRQLV